MSNKPTPKSEIKGTDTRRVAGGKGSGPLNAPAPQPDKPTNTSIPAPTDA